jgi:hypothetical protein
MRGEGATFGSWVPCVDIFRGATLVHQKSRGPEWSISSGNDSGKNPTGCSACRRFRPLRVLHQRTFRVICDCRGRHGGGGRALCSWWQVESGNRGIHHCGSLPATCGSLRVALGKDAVSTLEPSHSLSLLSCRLWARLAPWPGRAGRGSGTSATAILARRPCNDMPRGARGRNWMGRVPHSPTGEAVLIHY